MTITAEKKQELIKKFGQTEGDTGSPEVQVAVLTERIVNLTEHFKGGLLSGAVFTLCICVNRCPSPESANLRKLGRWTSALAEEQIGRFLQ